MRSIAVMMLVIALGPAARAQSRHNIGAEIHDSVEAWRSRNHQPTGLVLGVYSHGKVILTQTSGTMRLGSSKPLTAQSIFHTIGGSIPSMTADRLSAMCAA